MMMMMMAMAWMRLPLSLADQALGFGFVELVFLLVEGFFEVPAQAAALVEVAG